MPLPRTASSARHLARNQCLGASAAAPAPDTYTRRRTPADTAADAPKHWFRAKWRAEEAVRGSGIVYTIFRPSWIYGPGDRSLNRFLGMAKWLPFVPQIGNGRQLVAPVFVDDMGKLVADALETAAAENA